MKRFFRFVMAAAVLLTASCAKEDISSTIGGGEVEVTFTANLADMGTRAYGDGTQANVVYLGVYEAGSTTPLSSLVKPEGYGVSNGVATMTVVLLKDKVYDLVFWAQNKDVNCYTRNWEGRNIQVSYNGVESQAEARDAFFLVRENYKAGAATSETTFELRRPFAQLNVGLSAKDVEYIKQNGFAGYEDNKIFKTSEVTINNVNTVLSLDLNEDGDPAAVSAPTTNVTFAAAAVPTTTLEVNGVEYTHLSMNYLLVNEELIEVDYKFVDDKNTTYERTYYQVPVKRNYRTNILGQLISSPMDFNVVILPGFDGEYNDVWDGQTVAEPAYDDATKTYTIVKPSELAWLAAAVNGTLETRAVEADSFKGKTFVLANDIELGYKEWTPIGNATNKFQGTFDGNGKTISSLYINTPSESNVGLFGYTTDGEIKNLTIQNAKVSGYLNVAVVAGTPYTSKYTNITVKGHVEVNGMAYVGGVGGKNAYADWTNITVNVDETSYVNANSVENGTAYRTYVGGVVGFNGEGGHSFKNITSNINVEGSTCDVGGLFGIAHYGNKFEDCSCSGNVTITNASEAAEAEEIGGIAGVWHNGGADVVMTDCSFTGELSANIDEFNPWNGGLVGKSYNTTGTGKLIIDGVDFANSIVALQALLDGANGNVTIKLGTNLVGDVTVVQKPDVEITIDGNDHNYNGAITVNGKSGTFLTAALTIKDVNFKAESISADACINLGAKGNNNTRYTCNVTVDNCTFDVPGKVGVKSYTGGDKNLQILNSTAKANAHSLLQAAGIEPILIQKCKIYSKNGMNFNNSTNVTIDDCEADVKGYAVRFGAGSDADNNAETYTIKNSSLKSACEDGDAVIILRGTAAKATLTLESTTLEGDIQIANNATGAVVEIDGKLLVSTNEQLKAAVEAGRTEILLGNGSDYDLNGIQKDGLTLIGWGDGVEIANNTNFAGGGSIGAIWKAINLKNMTITNTVYTMDNGGNATFEDVTFAAGFRQGYGKGVVFTNCTFGSNSEGYALHFQTDSASEGGEIKLTGCKFNGGKVHLGGKRAYTFSGCEFAAGTDFQVWSNISLENCTVNGVAVTASNMATLFPNLNAEKVTIK